MAARPTVQRCSRCAHRLRSPRAPNARQASTAANHQEDGWETVVGLEIHAQIKTARKLFSHAQTSYNAKANSHVAPFDAAIPGALPVLNTEAIRLSLLTALALNCTINPRSTFDRKHYFYHDIPASYQITQHYNPLARSGTLRLGDKDVGIKQLQVEQDTAKSQAVGGDRLVDLNRAGTGLMEIVTEPDMRSAEEAGTFVKKLQSLLRRLGAGDGDMEKGNLRVDANVSVNRRGEAFGTRCEIKNINSVRFLQAAIESERRRHIQHYTSSSAPLLQETRGINELTGETFSLRTKEDAEDYRYMPDSNLPAMAIPPAYLDKLQGQLPEMPWDSVARIVEMYGATRRDAETLVGLDEYGGEGVKYFEQVAGADGKRGKRAMNWIIHELLGQLNKSDRAWTPDVVPAPLMRELVEAVDSGSMTGTTGKAVLRHLLASASGGVPADATFAGVLREMGISTSDSRAGGAGGGAEELEAVCREAIGLSPQAVEAVRKGKVNAVGKIVGEVMRLSKGRADAKRAREIVLALIGTGS